MKRSEAIKSINDFIKRTEGHSYPEGISTPGEWILQHIEQIGMKPPKHIEYNLLEQVIHYEWEPEDA